MSFRSSSTQVYALIGSLSNIDIMNPTTNVLLLCLVFLGNTVLSQHGRCTGKLCVFQRPGDFLGAQTACKASEGKLLTWSLENIATISTILPSGMNGSYWLELRGSGRTGQESAAGTPLQNCSSISVASPMGSNSPVSWEPCGAHLDGFLCQYKQPCSGLQAVDGAQVKYIAHNGFEVKDSDSFPEGTIAVVKKVGGEHPDSKHVCADSGWMKAPWFCEVMNGGCEHKCTKDRETNTCTCPSRQTLHPNNITCSKDPCADCAHDCQKEGDTHVCKCRKGYRLGKDGKSCVDVNECEEEDPCTGEGEECENIQGSFECRCKEDFVEENGVCVDVSICDKCEHMLCENSTGVYKCGCRKGFKVSARDPTKCDLDCKERDCPATCDRNPDVQTVDMLQCYCLDGYIRDTRNNTPICTDINECENKHQCDHKCENFFGGFTCSCNEGFKLHKGFKCVRIEEEDDEEESGSTPSYPTPASPDLAVLPSYIKTGSVLGITLFMVLGAVLLFFLVRNVVKRCGKFELSSLKHSNIDIFYLQQVTTETYKRLSFDKQFKNDPQIL